MSRVEHKLGLTSTLKRIAFYYLKKGLGEHPCEHESYDKVVVRELYGWSTPTLDAPAQGGIVVEFWRDGRRVRWVDIGCRVIGGGGESILREVDYSE